MTDYHIHIPGHAPFRLGRGRAELTIGRTPDQDIVIAESFISRRHARLLWREGAPWLEDLGSRHGCHVNGERLTEPRRLAPGDEVRLGPLPLTLQALVPGRDREGLEAEETVSLALDSLKGWALSGEDQRWRGLLDILQEASLDLLQGGDGEAGLAALRDRLVMFLSARQGCVFLVNAEGRLMPLHGCACVGPEADLLAAAMARREAVLGREPVGQASASWMVVPLEHAGEIFGLFYLEAGVEREPFGEDDLRIVASLGNLAAAGLLQRRMAEELRRRRDLERNLNALEASTRAQGELLAHVSHEIRNPLSAMLGFTEMALAEEAPPALREHLRRIRRSGQILHGVTRDILDFSKIEAGGMSLESIPFRLSEVMDTVADTLEPLAKAKGVAFRVEVGADVPAMLMGDPLRLGQVLLNLGGNAVKFTETGEVRIGVGVQGREPGRTVLRFRVRDTGIGLSPDQQARLFRPYGQAEASTSRRFGGTGLGLVISRRLVQLMGGEITLESTLGEGSTFTFLLASPEADAPAGDASPEAPLPDLHGLRVLLVEDNLLSRELMSELLGRQGVRVEAVATAEGALARAAREVFDVVLMDLELPDLDGREATARLHALPGWAEVPVLALTAHMGEEIQHACLEAGMLAHLTKPLEPERLFRLLGAHVSASSEPDPFQEPPPGGDLGALAGVLDLSEVLGRVGGDRALLDELLQIFLEHHGGAMVRIREALQVGDARTAHREAHSLMGSARILAAGSVAGAAGELEGELDHVLAGQAVDLHGVLARLDAVLSAFRAALEGHVGPPQAVAGSRR